jgi:hypothetical protein
MLPLRIASTMSLVLVSCGLSQVEKFSARRPLSTWLWTSQDIGAMLLYHGQVVWLEWQSPQAVIVSARVCGLSHVGSALTGGFAWLRP